MFKKVILTSLISTIVFFSITLLSTNAAVDHVIKAVYFVPKDRIIDKDQSEKLANQIEEVQQLYADQMEEHGYGNKTFRIHEDGNGNQKVHQIIGKFNDNYYNNDTLNKVYNELKTQFPDIGENIYIVSVDVSSERIGGNCGKARYDGGPVMIPLSGDCVQENHATQLIAHELGHALNLLHDFRDNRYYMSWGSQRDRFSECAASSLAVSPFLYDVHNHENTAGQIKMLTPETYPLNKNNWKLKFEVSDPDGIHQVKLEYSTLDQEAGITSCQSISNKLKTTVTFEMPNNAINAITTNIWLHVIDKNSHITTEEYALTGVEINQPFTYLTLEYDNPNALTPINPRKEWGWDWGGAQHTWEKKPNEDIPDLPHRGFQRAEHIFFIEKWDHWFYLHAEGRFIYDLTLTAIEHKVFDAYFYLPNPCGNVASVEMICSADGVEIYKSGVIRWAQAQNKHITFDIPNNTKEFIIEITDGGDDKVCDHYIIANAKLLTHEPEEPEVEEPEVEEPRSVEAKSKLVLTWAKLKRNNNDQ